MSTVPSAALMSATAPTLMAAAVQGSSIITPAMQKPIDMRSELKKIQAKNPMAVSGHLLAAAANPTPITGITFIPPLNCNPLIASPLLPKSALMMAAAVPKPDYFNWADNDNVASVKNWPSRSDSYVSSVFDQKSCGSCWVPSISARG